MTQAYIEGFRKTAEAYGVDPDKLLKQADLTGLSRFARQYIKYPLKRYWQLLTGNRNILKGYNSVNNGLVDLVGKGFADKNKTLVSDAQTLFNELGGIARRGHAFNVSGLSPEITEMLSKQPGLLKTRSGAYFFNNVNDVANELNKVYNTRLYTALGLGGIATGGIAAHVMGKKKPNNSKWPRYAFT